MTGTAAGTLTLTGTHHDRDGDAMVLSASAGDIVDNLDGTWTWTWTGGASGLVYVTATDSIGLQNQAAFQTQVTSPADVSATKTVSGTFRPGGAIAYTVTLTNASSSPQQAVSGDEFVDALPAGVILTSATASSGTAVASIGSNTVTWNGSIAATGSVTITISATVSPAAAPLDDRQPGHGPLRRGRQRPHQRSHGADRRPGRGRRRRPHQLHGTSSGGRCPGPRRAPARSGPGGSITYTVVLTNTGPAAQFDNPGDEFTDVLPAGL